MGGTNHVPVRTCVGVIRKLTNAQRATLLERIDRFDQRPERPLKEVSVFIDSLGLPSDYVAVSFEWLDKSTLVGGIDPDGRMST